MNATIFHQLTLKFRLQQTLCFACWSMHGRTLSLTAVENTTRSNLLAINHKQNKDHACSQFFLSFVSLSKRKQINNFRFPLFHLKHRRKVGGPAKPSLNFCPTKFVLTNDRAFVQVLPSLANSFSNPSTYFWIYKILTCAKTQALLLFLSSIYLFIYSHTRCWKKLQTTKGFFSGKLKRFGRTKKSIYFFF